MKQCLYCGKEYSDDIAVCPIDLQPLVAIGVMTPVEAPANSASEGLLAAFQKSEHYVAFPEYRWTQRDAWKCLGMFLVFDILWALVTGALNTHVRSFYLWSWSPLGVVTTTVIYAGLYILTVAYFGRTETLRSFCKAVGLDQKPSNFIWFGVLFAVGIQLVGYILYALHVAKLYSR